MRRGTLCLGAWRSHSSGSAAVLAGQRSLHSERSLTPQQQRRAARLRWKGLKRSVYGAPQQRAPQLPETHAAVPGRQEGERAEQSAPLRRKEALPLLPTGERVRALEKERKKRGSQHFSFTPPSPRSVRLLSSGVAVGSGGRKAAKAQARLASGSGRLSINGSDLPAYFPSYRARELALQPLLVSELLGSADVSVKVEGGGLHAQAGAVRQAIAEAIQNWDPAYRWALKKSGCLTRDARKVERKKTGKPKARRSKQWSKR